MLMAVHVVPSPINGRAAPRSLIDRRGRPARYARTRLTVVAAATGGSGKSERPPYEQARDELTELVKRLEAGGLTLEQSLQLWERGEELAAICEDWLEGARARLTTALAQHEQAGQARAGQAQAGRDRAGREQGQQDPAAPF
jgi:exodeoxyribonuclease VII small subunit